MILSDCGCSSNNTSLVSRVANRIDAHLQSAQPVAQPLDAGYIKGLSEDIWGSELDYQHENEIKFARAIERAHGIGAKE